MEDTSTKQEKLAALAQQACKGNPALEAYLNSRPVNGASPSKLLLVLLAPGQ